MAASSSTKKAAKLAGRSSGRSVQFQGGSVFPIALLLVVVLGVASIVYARQTIPGAGDGAPVTPISEYYDVAYGINICGDWATINDGDGAVNADGRIDYPAYRDTGVYQYAEGVATVHPYAAELADVPLDLSALLAVHGITIADDSLTFPEDQKDGKGDQDTQHHQGQETQESQGGLPVQQVLGLDLPLFNSTQLSLGSLYWV
ncbi:MAG: hypothetical protein ACPF97_07995 [Ilumatobacteraceae bacterium]